MHLNRITAQKKNVVEHATLTLIQGFVGDNGEC